MSGNRTHASTEKNKFPVQKTNWNGPKKFLTYLHHGTLNKIPELKLIMRCRHGNITTVMWFREEILLASWDIEQPGAD